MTNDIMPFEHPAFGKVRVIMDETTGEPWFVAKDVCRVLGLGNVGQAILCLDDDEKANVGANIITDDVQGGRQPFIISEPGLYSLIFRSRKPEARRFRKWVTSEVLPAIRKTGGYLMASANETPEAIMARAVLVAQDTINRISAELAEAQPKAALVDATFANRHHQPLRLAEVVRKLDGVDTLVALIVGYFGHFTLDENTRATLCFVVSSWFGTSSTFQIGKKA